MNTEKNLLKALQYAQRGDYEPAKKIFLKIIKKEPQNHNAYYNLAEIFRQQKNWQKAHKYFERTLNIIPDDPDALFGIGDALTQSKKHQNAIPYLQKAAAITPNDPQIIGLLAINYAITNKNEDAIITFQQALNLNPNDPQIWSNLIQTLHKISAWNQVILLSQKAQNILKKNIPTQILNLYADALLASENPDKAIEKAQNIINITNEENPQKAIAMITKAVAYNYKGEFKYAKKILQNIIENKHANPNEKATALEILSVIDNLTENHQKIIRKLMKQQNLTPQSHADIRFALYRYLNKNQNYHEAFQNLKNANHILQKQYPFNKNTHDKIIEETLNIFNRQNINKIKLKNQNGKGMIFIIGMPRSGTTLVEQILAAEPKIKPKGEFTLISRFANTINFPHDILSFTQEEKQKIAQNLQNQLFGTNNEHHTHAIDKTPGHYLFVGLIQAILPNAKIIYCHRNPKNVALSLFENQFRGHILNYSYNLSDIAYVYNAHIRLMSHWCQLQMDNIHIVDHEKLTRKPEIHIRKLYQFCNIPWNENALYPEKIKRKTLTSASFYQARQPIKPQKGEKWKKYQKYMQPFLKNFDQEHYQEFEKFIEKYT